MFKKYLSITILLLLVLGLSSCKEPTDDDSEIIELDTRYTDELTLDIDYENKNFLSDGIGVVELATCVDGDTAGFYVNNEQIRVRFLGINTPESTGVIQPWGRPASSFTCEILSNATEIVLESEEAMGVLDSTGTRYLAWVWVDGRLLNLEIVENAYTPVGGLSGSKYASIFYDADLKTQNTKRRYWGEEDPTYDYSGNVYNVTIQELKENYDLYEGKQVRINGVVSRKIGNHFFVESGGYGIYIYCGYQATNFILIGDDLDLIGSPAKYNDAIQLTGFNTSLALRTNVIVNSQGGEVTPTLITILDIDVSTEGNLVKIEDLVIVDRYQNSEDGSFTLYVEDSLGNQIALRQDKNTYPGADYELLQIGTQLDIIGPVMKYDGNQQVMITLTEDIEIKN